jgi:hypothetical protein
MQLTSEEKAVLANLNYDLNIWDEGMHNTCHLPEAEQYSQWKISVHNLHKLPDGYIQCGDWIEDINIYLTEDEAKALTLGWGTDLGGDYTQDEDFFLDIDSFFTVYKDIPERVKEELLSLPPIDIIDTEW